MPNENESAPTPVQPGDFTVIEFCLCVIAAVLVGAAATYLGPVLIPVIVAVFLYYILKPLAERLMAWGIPRWLAYVLLAVPVLVLSGVLGQLLLKAAYSAREQLPEYQERLTERLSHWLGYEIDPVALVDFDLSETFSYVFHGAFGILETGLMVFFYLLFIILGGAKVRTRVRRAFDPATADRLIYIGHNISENVKQYTKVKTLVSLGMGLSAGVLLYLFDVKYWPLWAFLTFAFNYITYVGSLAAIVPPTIVAFAQLSPGAAVAVTALLGVNRFVWIDYVEIRFSGKHLNIDPVLLLLVLAYFGWFWGVLGLVLAVPMLTCLKIVLGNFQRTRRLAILMSEE